MNHRRQRVGGIQFVVLCCESGMTFHGDRYPRQLSQVHGSAWKQQSSSDGISFHSLGFVSVNTIVPFGSSNSAGKWKSKLVNCRNSLSRHRDVSVYCRGPSLLCCIDQGAAVPCQQLVAFPRLGEMTWFGMGESPRHRWPSRRGVTHDYVEATGNV